MAELISVMIVDDEKLTLEDLSTIIDWGACGYKIVATAFNGKQGFRKYQEFHPQLILTDIRMPFMDGIEMISEIRKKDSKVSIVLLTAYEEFGYAKAAISLGITEYIIKSEITAVSMQALLERLNETIMLRDRKDMIVTDRMLEQFFLSDSLSGDSDMEQFLKKMFHVLIVEQDLPISVSGEQLLPGIVVPKVKKIDFLSHFDYGEWNLEAITSLHGGQIVLALNCQKNEYSEHGEMLCVCAEKVKDGLTRQFQDSFTVYAMDTRINLYNLKRFCDESASSFQKKYFDGSGRVRRLEYPPMQERPTFNNTWTPGKADDVTGIHDKAEIEQYFQGVYHGICRQDDMEQLKSLSKELYYILKKEYKKGHGKTISEDLDQEYNWADWIDTEKICNWFILRFSQLNTDKISEGGNYSKSIMEVIEYIYHNYRNPDLSLNDIADAAHLSVGYLSGAFKKETGVTLKNYITDIRIDAAKKLIERGNYKIYEICSQVGYHSSQYFSQAFYKKVGMFPTEYRKKE
ncbi:MAG: response regulator [Lachnospiraceae bacterium]|nr:response regulator [Lachnospiraceae bacterium]